MLAFVNPAAVASPDRGRLRFFVLRVLDARRAELRLCSANPEAGYGDGFDGRDSRSASTGFVDPEEFAEEAMAGRADPVAWTAVIPLDSLPVEMRETLRVARDLYDVEELDLSDSVEMDELLTRLTATTWAPEPPRASLH